MRQRLKRLPGQPVITPAPPVKNRDEVGLHFHKWSEVDERWLQYCTVCGKARSVKQQECKHKWTVISTKTLSRGNSTVGALYTLQCTKCGEISSKEVSVK